MTRGYREDLIKRLDRLGHETGIHSTFARQTRWRKDKPRSEETSRRNSRDHYRSLGVQVAGRDTSIECVSLYLAGDYRERLQEMLVEISHGRPCN